MGAAGNVLLVSVIISALDKASPVLRLLGLNSLGSMGLITAGAAAVVGGLAAIGVASVRAATTFDQNMQKIAALTATSAAQMQGYKDQLLAMAPALDQTPTALAQGLYFVISAGHHGGDALNILKLSAQAAAATMTPMANVADLLTTAINAYRGSTLTAGHAMDDLIKLVVNGKVTMSSLATSFGFVAETAQKAGLSFDEASAAVSTLSQIAGEHGSRRVMLDLDFALRHVGIQVEAVSKAASKMKGLTAPWNAAAFAAMNFMQKLQYIAKETHGVGYLDRTQAAAYEATGNFKNLAQATAHANTNFMTLVGGAAAFIPAAMLLSDKGAEYNTILKQMGGNGQATAQAFDSMRQSTAQQWKMFETAITSILTLFGEQLLPIINKVISVFYGLGKGILAWLGTKQGMQTFKYALLGIALVAGSILLPIVLSLVAGMAPFLAVVLAIVAGGIILGKVIQAVVAHFGGWSGVMKALTPILTVVKSLFTQAGKELKKALADPAIQSALKQLQQALPQLIPALKVLAAIVGVVLYINFQFFVAVLHAVISMLPGIITMFRGVIEVLGGLGRLVSDIFTGKWKDIPAALKQIFGGLLTIVGGALQAILGGAGGFISHFLNLFGSSGSKAKSAIGGLLSHIGTGIATFFTKTVPGFLGRFGHILLNELLAPFRKVGQAFQWLYDHNKYVKMLVDAIRHWLDRAKAFVTRFLSGIRTEMQKAWQALQKDVSTAWGWIYQHLIKPIGDAIAWFTGVRARMDKAIHDHVVKPIEDKINELVKNAMTWGQNLLTNFITGIKSKLGDLGNAAKNALKKVADFLGFHSPAPRVPESAFWGPNLIRMFAQGMVGNASVAEQAAQTVMGRVAARLGGTRGVGSQYGAAGSAYSGALAGGSVVNLGAGALSGGIGAGTVNVTHNWAGAFPNATSKDEIIAAIRQVQQQDYRAGRRPGSYGGLNAHTAIR
jgi:TP901 family phage tail tape measure protein